MENKIMRFTGKDQDWQNETTIYWFETMQKNDMLDIGEVVGVAESGNNTSYVDCDNYPIDNEAVINFMSKNCNVADERI